LGGVDPSLNSSAFEYFNLLQDTYWIIELDGVQLGDTSYNEDNMAAIIDTGTSVLVGPTEWVNKITANFPKKLDCTNISSYPDLTFTFGTSQYVIPPSYYILSIETDCLLGIQGLDLPANFGNTLILGDVFIRRYYTHFNWEDQSVGFAMSNQP